MEEKQYKWMVCTRCVTFNQAPYIEDAMNGFTMQQTTFPFVCTIVDDASTDGEPEVIRQYLQEHFDLDDKSVVRNEETDDYVLCYARHKENRNCHFAVLWLKYNHYSRHKLIFPYEAEWKENSKYYAICEGDDYWTSPKNCSGRFFSLSSMTIMSCRTRKLRFAAATTLWGSESSRHATSSRLSVSMV